jgi:hypothetical protein
MAKKHSWLNVKNSFQKKNKRASYFCIKDEDVHDLAVFIKKEFPAVKRERIEYSIQYSCSIAPPIEDLEKIIDSAKLYLTEVKYE